MIFKFSAIKQQLFKRYLPDICLGLVCIVFYSVHVNAAEIPRFTIDYEPTRAQPVFTLIQSVRTAYKNFPSIKSARYKVQAAKADITLAKTEYLPNLDLLAQEMRSTTNLLTGTILPQVLDVIPVQAGIEQKSASMKSYFGDNYGANFSWLLYDFGLRASHVKLARAGEKFARANVQLTELDVAYQAADDYLKTVANLQVIRANQATVERMQAAALTAHTLVDTGIRAGVDAALADFELSQAQIKLIEAEKQAELARVDLAESMGVAGNYIEVVAEPLIQMPGQIFYAPRLVPESHPFLQLRLAAIDIEAAKVRVQDRSYYPHLTFCSAIWGRGSGIRGVQRPVVDGVFPHVPNYAVGFSISFPSFDIFPIKAKRRHALALELSERANYDLAMQILEKKDARARVLLTDARRVANQTPIMVQAAKENQIKTLERYRVGLTDMVAVAQAERLLAQAEVENAVAKVNVWRAMLAASYVQGDLKPFLNIVAMTYRDRN